MPDTLASPEQLKARAAQVARDLASLRKELAIHKPVPRATLPESPPEEPKPPERNPYRPHSLDEIVGQERLRRQLRVVIHGTRLRGDPIAHTLISGPPGFGKSSIAGIIASEIGAKMVATTGMVLKKSDDLVAILVQQSGPTVLFIDEIHRIGKICAETLYTVMEDGFLDLIGSGETARHQLPQLVVVGATTNPGLLPEPFLARFGVQFTMDEYSDTEIATIAGHVWDTKSMPYDPKEALNLAQRSRGIPRRAVTFAQRVLDYAAVLGHDRIGEGDVAEALALFGIDANGLDEVDYKILVTLTRTYAGRPVGIAALAQTVGLDEETYREKHEPYLVRRGLLLRQRTGRIATRAAYDLTTGNSVDSDAAGV